MRYNAPGAVLDPDGNRTALKDYFQRIEASAATPRAGLPQDYWGSTDSLRMMTKFLGQPIFYIDATSATAPAEYKACFPERVVPVHADQTKKWCRRHIAHTRPARGAPGSTPWRLI